MNLNPEQSLEVLREVLSLTFLPVLSMFWQLFRHVRYVFGWASLWMAWKMFGNEKRLMQTWWKHWLYCVP